MLTAVDQVGEPSKPGDAISPPRLFISNSRADGRAFAEEFERRVEAEGPTSRTGAEIVAPRSHERSVWGAAFSPDDGRIDTASVDRAARVWNAATALSDHLGRIHVFDFVTPAFDGLSHDP